MFPDYLFLMNMIELTFNFKDDLYCLKDSSYIHMPIPMPIPLPMSQYRDFQVSVSLDFVSFI